MVRLLREIEYPEKSYSLMVCDAILRPTVNTVFGNRKITLGDDCTWKKEKRSEGQKSIFFANLLTFIFAPIIWTAACYKLHNSEHKVFLRMYHISKKQKFFFQQDCKIKKVDRMQPSTFTFVVTHNQKDWNMTFNNSGHLKFNPFFIHNILCKG